MCSPLINNFDNASPKKSAHSTPQIVFLPDSQKYLLVNFANEPFLGRGGGCFSEFIPDCKSVAAILATGTLVLALHTNLWDPHSSPQLSKHVFSSGVDLQLYIGFVGL